MLEVSQECGSDNGINAEFLSPGSSRTEGIKASDVLPVLKEKVAFVSGEFPPLLSCRCISPQTSLFPSEIPSGAFKTKKVCSFLGKKKCKILILFCVSWIKIPK